MAEFEPDRPSVVARRAEQADRGQVIDAFQEGPSAGELITAVMAYLRKWALRPWSIWHEELVEQGWTRFRAHLVMRFATASWVVAIHLIVALCAGAMLWGLGQLVPGL